jgi:integrase
MGRYKYGKPSEEIELEELREALGRSFLSLRYKAYVILLYWVGCRRSEPLFIRREDVEEENGSLYIDIPALKGGTWGTR